jgi:hypothetical protein
LWIRIPDPDPGFDDLNLKKIYSWKFNFYFIIKNCNLPTPRAPYRTPKLQEKPSALKREHPAFQTIKILYFFIFLRVIFALLDPDPQFECGSGSSNSN